MSLQRYVLKRLLITIPVLLGVTVITFAMVKLLPGNPVDYILQFQKVTPQLKQHLYEQYHLNQPIWKQYLLWLSDALTGNLGQSIIHKQNVSTMLAYRFPNTFALGLFAFVIAIVVGIPTGVVSAIRQGDWADEASRVVALLGIATPNFWLGLMFLLVFGVWLGWFHTIPPADVGILSGPMLHFMILPAITLGTASAAQLMRLMRSSMLEQKGKDYVRTARAKGLSERRVVVKHIFRNSLIAVVTVAALQVAFLVDGAVVVENVFSWPGLGRLLVNAITQRDFPVIQAAVLLFAVSIVVANFCADILYSVLDPRIRY